MATPTVKAASESVTELPALAQKTREQLLSTLGKGHKLSIDAAQGWVKAVSALPTVDVPAIPGFPGMPDVEAATKFTFDVAADLLKAQRDFSLELANILVPVKTA